MSKLKIFECYANNIKAMETVIKKKEEEIRQLQGQLESAKENLAGSITSYVIEACGFLNYEKELVDIYSKALVDVDLENAKKLPAALLMYNSTAFEAILAEVVAAEFNGVTNAECEAGFILLNEDIAEYDVIVVNDKFLCYSDVRMKMLEHIASSELLSDEIKERYKVVK